MEFSKLSAPSLKELFVEQLESMILSGKLPVGEQLPPERILAESMQVSRAVVNAGITELARKGFLTIKPRIGTFVGDYRRNGSMETLMSIMNYNGGRLRDDEVRSILELRIAMDSLIMNLCIQKITSEEMYIVREYVFQIKEAKTIEEAAHLAFQFQHELACLSGNTLMPLIFHSFKVPILTLWERFCQLYGIESLYKNTSKLYEYIERRDSEAACKFIKDSINDTISGTRQIYY